MIADQARFKGRQVMLGLKNAKMLRLPLYSDDKNDKKGHHLYIFPSLD